MAEKIFADPSASFFLKDAVKVCLTRDPLDALRDAETLVALLADHAGVSTINGGLYGVLNAVRVATKFGLPITELMPRIDEVLAKAESEASDAVPHCCPVHDGDYSSFFVSNNCD